MIKRLFKSIFFMIVGALIAIAYFSRFCEKIMEKVQESASRNNYNFKCACSWLNASKSKTAISEWLKNQHIQEVAIYGMGNLGKHLLDELEKTDICVKYLVDRNTKKDTGKYVCYSNVEKLPKVQAIIVTPAYEFKTIAESLEVEDTTEIISLENIINSL